jgi:hypothetical protein
VVSNPENVVDGNDQTFAVVDFPVAAVGAVTNPAVNGTAKITVDLANPVAAGGVAAFDMTFPGGAVEADVVQVLNIRTFQGDTESEVQNKGTTLDLLSLIGPTGHVLVGFVNQKPYNRLEAEFDATLVQADVLGNTANVFDACTAAVPPTP